MAKQSKRNRRRMHQAGMGGGFTVVRRVPIRVQRGLPQASILSTEATFRLLCIEHAARRGVADAAITFKTPVSTISRWRKRYRPDDLTSLEPRSRRPKRTRRATWTAAQEQAVLALRHQYPRLGKMPLQVLLRGPGVRLSASMIGRILGSLRRRDLLRELHAVRVRKARPQRPYATRGSKAKRQPPDPGALIQLDTRHRRPLPGVERRPFTAIDVVSRIAVVGVRARATAGTARAFRDDLMARMPFPVQAIQGDGGSEVMAGFERACQARNIALYVLPPRSPKLNDRVERLNGTARREVWECDDGELDLPTLQQALQAWEVTSKTIRPHQAL
ncbi:MAG: helix-turn-helix domain-containing protein, partial [Chloroflexota bacterium]|nr:helix-turn-helix domain-containing protein [Chloroflexota bacterium]